MTIYQNTIAGSGFLQGPKGDTGPAANTNIITYEYVATGGQTTFTGVDSNLNTLAYTPAGLFVTLNGSVLNDIVDYTATNGTSIVLVQAANAGDELNIYTFPAFNVANTYTQSQTNSLLATKLNVTGGTIAGELAITGNTSISSNGYLQVPIGTTAQRPAATTQGYIRYNTTLNSLESANGTAWSNVGSGAASSGGGVTWTPTVQNTSFIAVTGNGYLVNTAIANVTVTLPTSPTFGNFITITDYGYTFGSNNLILYPNGNKIQGNTGNVRLTVNGESISLVYTDTNKGWVNYNGFVNNPVGNYTATYLIVAGGGGVANYGGGGAGGLLQGTVSVTPGTTYSLTVGAGGTAGTNGSNSTGFTLTAVGGGFGINGVAGSGGSGGGTGRIASSGGLPGSGTAGQGYPGGTAADGVSVYTAGGGGGGAGGAGTPSTNQAGAPGGAGALFPITSTYYAGGGGGGANNSGNGSGPWPGGTGGGGTGIFNSAGGNGGTNLGGGGGGGNAPSNGGSGVVIVAYLGGQRATGGSVSFSNGYTIHTFISSGTFIA